MKIKLIKELIDKVFFSSSLGSGVAKWNGDKFCISECYDVEIDFDAEYVWGKDIYPSDFSCHKIIFENGMNKIFSRVIAIEEDVITIQLDNNVVFIEVLGVEGISVGCFVMFYSSPDKTVLTPFNL
ncbi:hypothetical protein AU512_16435 [Lonsdalea iberica]|uniref:Uncharacterized protein n=2 Tax=Lonsdalea TaxID=1082702 RepID=A0AAD0SEX3_9GAMM|nr:MULTISPECIES: hypothetical protein [Lonsdalea]AXW86065.1 hypothetical protein CKQ53_03105 [Lonsdalea britannica]OSM97849.1 hypothetical protein AU509_07410 [Lonsdalea britannica]OSN04099.1 hypothetical protein AU512_16435 [Lonsdalea iberica]